MAAITSNNTYKPHGKELGDRKRNILSTIAFNSRN
jgi:hypothetical protein